MISVRNLSRLYGKIRALDDITFEINSGEIVGFIGPNGAGKSTLMKILTGYLSPSLGDVYVDSHCIQTHFFNVAAEFGYLPEDNPLYKQMTVFNFLNYIGTLRGIESNQLKTRLSEVVDFCKLESVLHLPIEHCSRGYRQRVGIAQAIIHRPKILILDEPTSGLDPIRMEEIRDLVISLKGEMTIILSSHVLTDISSLCSRVFILNKGRIIKDGAPDTLFQSSHFEIRLDVTLTLKELKEHLSANKDISSISLLGSSNKFNMFLISAQKDVLEFIFSKMASSSTVVRQLYLLKNLDHIFSGIIEGNNDHY